MGLEKYKASFNAAVLWSEGRPHEKCQIKSGYNVQIGVDSEYIVAVDIVQDRNNIWTLVPFLKYMDEKPGFRYLGVTADSGYESEEAYDYPEEQNQMTYIKP